MKNIDIKKIFLHLGLSILNSETVLDATIQELNLSFQRDSGSIPKVLAILRLRMTYKEDVV